MLGDMNDGGGQSMLHRNSEEYVDLPQLIITGIRGVPAAHGGFETFAERLALHVEKLGWDVSVYCQGSATGELYEDNWNGIRRIHVPTRLNGAAETIEFDVRCALHVLKRKGTILTLGYNTGFLNLLFRAAGRKNYINMDGLEWKRQKYGVFGRAFLWINERFASWAATSMIADHPGIADHLRRGNNQDRIQMIPYGSEKIAEGDPALLKEFGLTAGGFFTLIARPEPENQILELVRAFSVRNRGVKLAVLGRFSHDHPYQSQVLRAAGSEVVFTGPVYDSKKLAALRCHSIGYLHGHQVGGTNPSLVEALGAGNPVIAHDNVFNRWVAQDAGLYFKTDDECDVAIDSLIQQQPLREKLSDNARSRWAQEFTWPHVLRQYSDLLSNEGAASSLACDENITYTA